MKLLPVLVVGLAVLLGACGSDYPFASEGGDEYTSAVKQADEARKDGAYEAAVSL